MRRWNGWGAAETVYPLPESVRSFLEGWVPPGARTPDTSLGEALQLVPASRLPEHPAVDRQPHARLLHARGQSLPDWIALRSGMIDSFPDGVACPQCGDEVRSLLSYAEAADAYVIPYGGGTSVVGHLTPQPGDQPSLTIDLQRLDSLLAFDEESRLATFGCGVTGPALERQLEPLGYTLGHFPQSWEYSTLGGWVATRSTGQQSYRYGRIEDLFAGGRLENLHGTLVLNAYPASAAGPDLRQFVLGSEGRLGVLTEATVRVRPIPAREFFLGVFFRTWEDGRHAVREVVQAGIPISMLRLSDERETETSLALAGHERLLALGRRALGTFGYGSSRALMIVGFSGGNAETAHARSRTLEALRAFGGLNAGSFIGEQWRRSRFKTPYLRNTLWDHGYALDTLETALPWSAFEDTRRQTLDALARAFEARNVPALIFSHLSHVYRDGASFYVTCLFPRDHQPEVTLETWRAVKQAASLAIQAGGGTISHQHGVGLDHRPYLREEKGRLGSRMLRTMAGSLDPEGLFNPGKLFEDCAVDSD